MKYADGFIRDPNTGAVINIDNKALQAYKLQKLKHKKIESKIESIDKLKEEVSEIKMMLSQILEKLNK